MKTIGNIFLYIVAALLLAWLFPWLYGLCTAKPYSTPFTLYSCVLDDFASLEVTDKGELDYFDTKGNHYTDAQFDSIQPMFYYRQLVSEGRMPDTLRGRAVDLDEVRLNNFNARLTPGDINRTMPNVYMILESKPERVDLDDAVELFRPTDDGLVFIDMRTNETNQSKSEAFTNAMKQQGFEFPIALLNGNPTAQKEYDEGYVMADHAGTLFHVKQVQGKPFVRRIDTPQGVRFSNILITEFPNRKTLAYLSDESDRLYILRSDYVVTETDVRYNPHAEGLMVVGDLFFYTIRISSEDAERYYALDADSFELVDTLTRTYTDLEETDMASFFFPFRLSFTSYNDGWVYPRFADFSARALILGCLLAICYAVWRRKKLKSRIVELVLIVAGGVFALIPILLIRRD